MKRKRIKIKYLDSQIEVPVIKFRLNGSEEDKYAILDSGSERSLFDKELIKSNKKAFKIRIPDKVIELVGVSSSFQNPVIKASAFLDIQDAEDTARHIRIDDAIVADLSNLSTAIELDIDEFKPVSALIGSDIFTKYKAKLDYQKKEFSYYGFSCE